MERDFTYIDDIVEGVVRVLDSPATASSTWRGDNPDPATSYANYKIYNIGNNDPIRLMDFIETLESALGINAVKNFMPMQNGDVLSTYADITELSSSVGFKPSTPLDKGIVKFVKWYRGYYLDN